MSTDSEPLEVWCAGSDWCPITTTATLIGKKWHPVVIHRLLENGPLGFNAHKQEVYGISGQVESDALEEHGFIERAVVSEKPLRVGSWLTDRGGRPEPMHTASGEWGGEHRTAPEGQ